PGLGRLLARRDEVLPAGVALGPDPLRDAPLGANRHRRARYEPERLAHALHFLVGERALRALAADAELLEPRHEVLRLHVPFLGQLVDALRHHATTRSSARLPTAGRRAPRAPRRRRRRRQRPRRRPRLRPLPPAPAGAARARARRRRCPPPARGRCPRSRPPSPRPRRPAPRPT